MNEFPKTKIIGCILTFISFLFIAPMWFALIFGILWNIDAPTWMWVLYWVWCPLAFMVGFMKGLVVDLLSDDN